MRSRRERVLILPADRLGVVAVFGECAHRLIGEDVVQTVVGHAVAQRHITIFVTLPALFEQMRGLTHGFLTARDDDLVLASADQLIRERDRVDTGQAHLVHRQGGHIHRNARCHGRLPGRDLPRARGEHLAHDHVVDLFRRDAALLQRRLDGETAQVGTAEVLQTPEQSTDRGSRTGDDHGCGHDEPRIH